MSQTHGNKDEIWIINLKATVKSPIYTGEIRGEEIKKRKRENKVPTRKTGDNFAAVSIYGPLRRYAQHIYKNEGACDIGKNNKGCKKCLICDLFGYLGKKGRAIFTFLRSDEPFNKVVDGDTHISIETDSGAVNSFIILETIKEGTTLSGNIIIKDPKEKDLEVILSALKAAEENGIGGWTKRDLGRVKFDYTIEKKKWEDYRKQATAELKKILK
ncbi:MAG: hypothetical protein ACTSRZ_15095 [Promethearchaeota archaeon]